jgi:hypothetical protein
MMTVIADLDELDLPLKMIHDLLIAGGIPPFDRDIIFATRCDDPKRNVLASEFMDLRIPRFFLGGQINIALECRWLYRQAESVIQEFDEAMKAMIWGLIAAIDERIRAIQYFHPVVFFGQRRDLGIIEPKFSTGRADIRDELAGIVTVKIANRCGQHHDVTKRQPAFKNELSTHFFRSVACGLSVTGSGLSEGDEFWGKPAFFVRELFPVFGLGL